MSTKIYSSKSVYTAAIDRLEYIYSNFKRVYLSVSFGKDSSVMLHLALGVARRLGKLPVSVLFIDLEGQYKFTIDHAKEMLLLDDVNATWVCLPLNLRNAVSTYQPFWTCWDPAEKDRWIRPMPEHDCVVSDVERWNWFRHGMEFEEFIVEFAKWVDDGQGSTACCVGIRSDESLNRFRTIASSKKTQFNRKPWTTEVLPGVYNAYPIYDWKTEDIWTAVGKNQWSYNRIYDFMYMAGMSIHESRICQPYGDDQRRGLDLFHRCEPETWFRVVNRVTGANFGQLYAKSALLGFRKMKKPDGHTWRSYTEFLLSTLPRFEQEWFKRKFEHFWWWWEIYYGIAKDEAPDEGVPKLESDRKVPSWRRLARAVITNDKLCKSLSFGQTKHQWEKYTAMREDFGE